MMVVFPQLVRTDQHAVPAEPDVPGPDPAKVLYAQIGDLHGPIRSAGQIRCPDVKSVHPDSVHVAPAKTPECDRSGQRADPIGQRCLQVGICSEYETPTLQHDCVTNLREQRAE
jgi:hypothetical protein